MRRAFDRGVTHFDLANNYGPPPGSAEENFGRILRDDLAGYRDELVISTKAGYLMWPGPYGEWGSRKYLLSSLDQSLRRMGLPYVDIFYSHRFDPNTPLEETMGALDTAVRQGKALYAGISNYSAEQTRAGVRYSRLASAHRASFISPNTRCSCGSPKDGLFDVLGERGVGCIAFSPLAQGLLTDRYLNGIPDDSRAAKPHGFLKREQVTPEKIEQVRQLNDVAQATWADRSRKWRSVWLLKDSRVTSVLIGASSVEQLDQNLDALRNGAFSAEELAEIERILAQP